MQTTSNFKHFGNRIFQEVASAPSLPLVKRGMSQKSISKPLLLLVCLQWYLLRLVTQCIKSRGQPIHKLFDCSWCRNTSLRDKSCDFKQAKNRKTVSSVCTFNDCRSSFNNNYFCPQELYSTAHHIIHDWEVSHNIRIWCCLRIFRRTFPNRDS